ncbi:DUF6089 family protein [Reichenbachiella carrageenanivorans]|uniref:DUF6089 family protein n=1 Tax=Reichenbachiella carrageenanivorans TaxID=2979869 RepID=A0ABY6D0C7_9BACT|nr:DUF6089 family protein [Reichenbachiella carrageenanivorans]UXX79616.1 DUF6089 family protein [Reichenbachiella carrageenanivorans]
MKNLIPFILILLCVFDNQKAFAQDSLKQKTKEIHLGIGPASYSGDLGKAYAGSSLLFTAGLKFNNNKKLNGNVKISIGSVTGQELDYATTDDSGVPATPNTFFKSTFIGLNYEAQFNFINKEKIKVYLSQGIGLFRFDPRNEEDNRLSDLPDTRPVGESYRNIVIQLPTQLGAKYYLPNDFALGIQVGFINPITDHLDNLAIWGNKNGNDNILSFQFQIHAPLSPR